MKQSIKIYNIIIIGSGIAGLYSAYKIKKMSDKISFLVLEKYKKKWIGGRMNNETFHGTQIVTGAGIGRKDTNPLLIKLLRELHVPFEKSISIMNYSNLLPNHSEFDVVKIIDFLKKEYNKNPDKYKHLPFKDFGILMLGDHNYKLFTIYAGYTDYENADIYETLYNYGMDDNKGGWPILYIPWKELVERLCEYIDYKNIKNSNNVTSITKINDSDQPSLFEIRTEHNDVFYCNKVILATTISGIKKLIPGALKPQSVYNEIHSQPFLRLYAKFDKKSSAVLEKYVSNYTIVPGPLQKIIPINSKNGVYMIAYSDNFNAEILKNYLKNNYTNRKFYEKLVEQSLGIPEKSLKIEDLKDFYWPIGTHYYSPLHGPYKNRSEFIYKAQHPIDGILVVGEAVSTYQGWVEGALESVEAVVNKKWVQTIC
jgi:hypothetical protein